MQIKKSINILALVTLMITNVPAQGINIQDIPASFMRLVYQTPLEKPAVASNTMTQTIKKYTTYAALIAFAGSIYHYNDKTPTKEPSRADWNKLQAELEGASFNKKLCLITKFIQHFIDDEIIGHKDKSSYMKAESNQKISFSEAVPGKGMYFTIMSHKDALIKTLCAPIAMAALYRMLLANHILMEQVAEGDISLLEILQIILGKNITNGDPLVKVKS